MPQNTSLQTARREKNDEFYTQLSDIEYELKHYTNHFRERVIYCNCDDPRVSNFYHYFAQNFAQLGIKRLITTCYQNQQPDLFSRHDSEKAISLDLQGSERTLDGSFTPKEPIISKLNGDGDFRSPECIEFLKQADIVITNPPFSLFREYVAQLVEYGKKFIIIGNKNAISYKEIFQCIKDGKLWIGHTPMGRDLLFDLPKEFAAKLVKTKREGSAYKFVNGVIKGRSQSIWFTNLDHPKRHEKLELYKHYTPEEYPKYDNYDAIEVSKTAEIPKDYEGAMGVPISFLDKFNPKQFDIHGRMSTTTVDQFNFGYPYIGGKRIYARVIILNKEFHKHEN